MLVDSWIVEQQSFIRELINGGLMVTCAWCAAICALYVVQMWIDDKGDGEWRNHLGTRVACALAWVFGFESYRTGSIWSVYYDASMAAPNTGSFNQTVGFMIGGIGLIIAILYSTYLFSPPRQKARLWAFSFISAVLFLMTATILKGEV